VTAEHAAGVGGEVDQRDGSFLIGWKPVTRQDYLAFTDAIGFGDDRTEPAARPNEMVDAIQQAFSEADEHRECPIVCELCGETLAATVCEHCHGSGGNNALIEATLAYSECEWCAGAGKVHQGCVEKSYADLVTELATTRQTAADTVLAAAARLCCGDNPAPHHAATHDHSQRMAFAEELARAVRHA
jgi:hypothetical protein